VDFHPFADEGESRIKFPPGGKEGAKFFTRGEAAIGESLRSRVGKEKEHNGSIRETL